MADVNEKRFTNVRIQHRTKTSAEWLAFTEAPLKGELCVELNVSEAGSAVSTKIKIGDGHTLFKDLAYVDGKDGTSVTVSNVSESTEDGGNNIVTFSDGKTLTVKNGTKGSQGKSGAKGDKGDKGDRGEQGIQGLKGETGEQGEKGTDGTSATHRWSGTTLYVTSASGTSSANLKGEKGDTGANGKDGTNGKDGVSPSVSVYDIYGGHRVTITDKDGDKTFDVMDGKDGEGGGGGGDSVENVKLSASCVFAEEIWSEMVSHEAFTQDTLKNFTVIDKCGGVAGNYFSNVNRTNVGLYKDANNYLKLYIRGYAIILENSVGGTKTTKSYNIVKSLSNASDVCSKLDLVRKKVEMHGLVNGVVTTFIDEDISSYDLSTLDTFHLVSGAGKHRGYQFNIYARINDYFDYAALMKQHLYMSEYNALPVVDGEKDVYEATSIKLQGTIVETISETHKISNVSMSSDGYFAMQSANTDISTKVNVSIVTRFKVTNMSDDTNFGIGAGSNRANIVDENGVCVWDGSGRFTPEVDKWYYLASAVARNVDYGALYGMRAVGTFTIEVDGLFICSPRSINMCAETWNGKYFTGALPFKGTGVNFVSVNSFTGSGKFVPILATNIQAGKINMYNGSTWVNIG